MFLSQLTRQGLSEDKIPAREVQNYLWNQPYILRFDEEGKEIKHEGDHIWHVYARKDWGDRWEFRPFHRALTGSLHAIAYPSQRWSWQPHVWDPQRGKFSGAVRYGSPSLPTWLSWKDDVLTGVPPGNAQSCEVTVTAEVGIPSSMEARGFNAFHPVVRC